jgi:gliotoxin/aspirochlorine biosynthesis aminotransferase
MLGAGSDYLSSGLSRLGVEYITADYGLFVFARIGRNCQNDTDEQDMVKNLAQKGLIVAPGRKFSCGENEHGWARLNFAVSQEKLATALRLLEGYLGEAGAEETQS